MNNTVFINALSLSEYAFKELPEGGDAFGNVVKTALDMPDVRKIYVLSGDDFDRTGPYEIIRKSIPDMKSLIKELSDNSENYDNLFYLYGDTPLIDIGIVRRMYANHQKYFASYTFADGYPYGLTPEIIKRGILPRLGSLAEKHPFSVTRGGLFEVIQKDINSFDIETEISEKDQRMLRVSLSCDTKRNFNQLQRIIRSGGRDETSIVNILETRQDLLRTEPAFVNVQIAGGCPQVCSYCPYPGINGDVLNNKEIMSLENWKIILKKVKEFSDDAVFSVSLWGEPAMHPGIIDMVKETLSFSGFSVIIETSGIGWSTDTIDALNTLSDGRITWILSLDGENPEIYKKLRGEGMETALAAAEYLYKTFKENFYLQSVRMKANEEFLEKFFRTWKERGIKTIIQKYDHFCGVLADEKVTDISPVRRYPCWHLKRDLTILLDGTVQLCREDLKNDHALGNIFTEDLPEIWNRAAPLYLKHIKGEYPGICGKCDEYYTFNF